MANTFIFDDEEPQSDLGAPAPEPIESEEPEAGEGNNRTFLIAAIILGGIVLLSLICMAVLAVVWLPSQNAMRAATQEANIAASTQAAFVSQQTQQAASNTATLPPTEVPTLAPTETPVVVFATSTASPAPSSDPATATVQALQTQLAAAQVAASQTAEALGTPGAGAAAGKGTPGKTTGTPGKTTGTPGATSQLAKTGFADEVGLPGLFILSIILVAVILLARRLRQAPLAH
jgi:type II secretory pathway pseudopilin PulG